MVGDRYCNNGEYPKPFNEGFFILTRHVTVAKSYSRFFAFLFSETKGKS